MKRSGSRMRRATLAVCMTCGFAVLWPAVGLAKTTTYNLVFGPLMDHGYKVEGVVTPETSKLYNVGFVASRVVGNQSQDYTFGWSKQIKFKASSGLSSASASSSFGSHGSMSLKFAAAGAVKQVSYNAEAQGIADCKFPKRPTREGTATGTLKFNTDTVFGTIKATKLKASLVKIPSGGSCKPETTYALSLAGSDTADNDSLLAFSAGGYTAVGASYTHESLSNPFSYSALISESKPKSIFTHSGLTSAKVKVSGSFLSGTASYKATSGCAKGSTGTATGTIKAHFLIGGTHTYPATATGTFSKNFGTCTN